MCLIASPTFFEQDANGPIYLFKMAPGKPSTIISPRGPSSIYLSARFTTYVRTIVDQMRRLIRRTIRGLH
jgi:hypothetical protein